MKVATVQLTSMSAYSQSRFVQIPKNPKETHDDYEKRTWHDRLHVDSNGMVYIPPMSLKNCLSECAKFLSIQIPGKGKSTYTKHFEAGISVMDPIQLNQKAADISGEWFHVPSDGMRGGSKRVLKCFPVIPKWTGTATIYILDETVTRDVLMQHLGEAGKFIGMGRFRPRNNGFYGRFKVELLSFDDYNS